MNRTWIRLVSALSILAILVVSIGALTSLFGTLLTGRYAAPALLVVGLLLVFLTVTVAFTSHRLLPNQRVSTPYW